MNQEQHIHEGGLRQVMSQLDQQEVKELSQIKEEGLINRFRAWLKVKRKFWALRQKANRSLYQKEKLIGADTP